MDSLRKILKQVRRGLVRLVIGLRAGRRLPLLEFPLLVIAPHPDDEVFGCGGLLADYVRQGVCHILYLTNGDAAHQDCCGYAPGRVAAARRALALKAMDRLGVPGEHLHFCGWPDGELSDLQGSRFAARSGELVNWLQEFNPATVLIPHPMDCWPDHEAAARISLDALRGGRARVYLYPVWIWYNLPLRWLFRPQFRRILRFACARETVKRKRQAIECYVQGTPPGCAHSWCGKLPHGFLRPFLQPYEFFFEVQP